jgi:hypothetical protein
MNNSLNSPAPAGSGPSRQLSRRQRLVRALRVLLCVAVSLATLAALFYTEENWRGRRAWEAYAQELTAKGRALDCRLVAPPPIPDEQNFAMTPLLAPLFDFEPGTQTYRNRAAATNAWPFAGDNVKEGDWHHGVKLEQPAAAVLEALGPIEPILTELRVASGRPHARFNLCYEAENPAAILLPHLSKLKGCVRMLSLRASAKLALGDADAALEDLKLGFYLMQTMREEPILISHLVRGAMVNLLVQPVWEGIVARSWTDAQLLSLTQTLQGPDFLADYGLALRGEQAFGNGVIGWIRRHPERLENLLDMGDPDQSSVRDSVVILNLIPQGWLYLEQVNYNRLFEELIRPGCDPATRRMDPALIDGHARALEASLAGNAARRLLTDHRMLSRMLLPALTRPPQRFAYAQTCLDEAALACALERHRLSTGQFPETLAALTPQYIARVPADILTGAPLKYRRTERGGFLLYSVGWNLTDEGGEPSPTKGKRARENNRAPELAQGDWSFKVP